MPFHGTPESLIARSDSKNPAFTCRGLTSNGRPCRRAISQTPGLSPSPQSSPRTAEDMKAFCWQHREQATPISSPSPTGRKRRPDVIREKNSVDSLVHKLGIVELEEQRLRDGGRRKPATIPDPDTPLPSIERDASGERDRRKKNSSKRSNGSTLRCCFGEIDNGYRTARPAATQPQIGRKRTVPVPNRNFKVTQHLSPGHQTRPSIQRDPSSRTGEFLALIPPTASPALTAQLLAELAKPFSEADDEGYIYMFWLTPDTLPIETPSRTASTLLAPPTSIPRHQRRTSDVLSDYSSTAPSKTGSEKQTMLLKIGRTQNVHRRLTQWTKQCDYNLSLIRYYPYHTSASTASSFHSTRTIRDNAIPRTPRKVPNAGRIERLIHIELAEKRVKGEGKCEKCGREHREWFEVDASRDGVKQVDEVIKRWVGWGEKQASR